MNTRRNTIRYRYIIVFLGEYLKSIFEETLKVVFNYALMNHGHGRGGYRGILEVLREMRIIIDAEIERNFLFKDGRF